VGVADGYPFDSCKIVFNPGDTLLVFTDGVTDPENSQGQDFGVEGIRKTIQQLGKTTPQKLIDRIVEAVGKHAFGSPQFDDIALVSVGRLS
jgi:serine phosphatase RsbU (regulator of sigma subunit)